MPPVRKKCTNNPRVPAGQRETNVLTCFRRGVGVGKRLEQEAQMRREHPQLNTLTLRRLGDFGRIYGIRRYSMMTKQELIIALEQAGYPN
jgi:hypothetical protein